MQQKMAGISRLKTAQKARVRAMPKQFGQEYLDMYLSQKRAERHERECENLEVRREFLEEDKKYLLEDMRKLRQSVLSDVMEAETAPGGPEAPKPASAPGKKRPRSMKKMDIQY